MKNWVVRGICGDLTLLHKKLDLNWLKKGKRQTFFLKVENFKSTLQKNTLKNTLWSINILKSCLQDVSKTSPRRLQDVLETCMMSSRRLQDVFKTSWSLLYNVLFPEILFILKFPPNFWYIWGNVSQAYTFTRIPNFFLTWCKVLCK